MSVIDNSNLGTLWNRILGLFSARKINNKSLAKDITINDEDIPSTAVNGETTVEGALGNIADQLSDQSQQIGGLQAAAAYVEDGDVATRTYTAGQFILWKGHLYTVNSGGLQKDTAITENVNVTAVTGGGFNAVNNELNALNSDLTDVGTMVRLGSGQGTGEINLSESIRNFRFIFIQTGYYGSGFPQFGQALLPVSSIATNTSESYSIRMLTFDSTIGSTRLLFTSDNVCKILSMQANTWYTVIFGVK